MSPETETAIARVAKVEMHPEFGLVFFPDERTEPSKRARRDTSTT